MVFRTARILRAHGWERATPVAHLSWFQRPMSATKAEITPPLLRAPSKDLEARRMRAVHKSLSNVL